VYHASADGLRKNGAAPRWTGKPPQAYWGGDVRNLGMTANDFDRFADAFEHRQRGAAGRASD